MDELLQSDILERRSTITEEVEDSWESVDSLGSTILKTPHYFTSIVFIPVCSVIFGVCFMYFLHNDWPDKDCFATGSDSATSDTRAYDN